MCLISQTPQIATPRLTLRKPRPQDAARIAELCADPAIPRMTTRMPAPYGLQDAERFIAMTATEDPASDNTFVVEHREAGLIGAVGMNTAGRLPEIGYWIGRPFWGQGFATEAARAALVWAHQDWGRKAVLGGHFADNAASAAVLTKAGFLYTGQVEMRHSAARGEVAPTRMMIWVA